MTKPVVNRIVGSTRSLGKFPQMGRTVPEFADESVREVFVYSYRIIYKIYDDRVVIAAVVHGKRQL